MCFLSFSLIYRVCVARQLTGGMNDFKGQVEQSSWGSAERYAVGPTLESRRESVIVLFANRWERNGAHYNEGGNEAYVGEKRGSLWGNRLAKGDFDSSAFCAVLSSSSRAAGTNGRRRWEDQRQKWRYLEWYHANFHDKSTKNDIL